MTSLGPSRRAGRPPCRRRPWRPPRRRSRRGRTECRPTARRCRRASPGAACLCACLRTRMRRPGRVAVNRLTGGEPLVLHPGRREPVRPPAGSPAADRASRRPRSLPSVNRAPPSWMAFHCQARIARSTPRLSGQAPAGFSEFMSPSATCIGCIEAMMPSLPKRGISAGSMVSTCSMRLRRPRDGGGFAAMACS